MVERKIPRCAYGDLGPQRQVAWEAAHLVSASDYNREMISRGGLESLPEVLAYGSGVRGVYWWLHANHLGEMASLGVNADLGIQGGLSAFVLKNEDFLQESRGRLRSLSVSAGGFVNLLPTEDFTLVHNQFFDRLESIFSQARFEQWSEDEKRRLLAECEVIQTIAHFPPEASGRTNEDFMVYLAQKMGLAVSFSDNGLRGGWESPLVKKSGDARKLMRTETVALVRTRMIEDLPEPWFKKIFLSWTYRHEVDLEALAKALNRSLVDAGKQPSADWNAVMTALTQELVQNLPIITTDGMPVYGEKVAVGENFFSRGKRAFERVLVEAQGTEYRSYSAGERREWGFICGVLSLALQAESCAYAWQGVPGVVGRLERLEDALNDWEKTASVFDASAIHMGIDRVRQRLAVIARMHRQVARLHPIVGVNHPENTERLAKMRVAEEQLRSRGSVMHELDGYGMVTWVMAVFLARYGIEEVGLPGLRKLLVGRRS